MRRSTRRVSPCCSISRIVTVNSTLYAAQPRTIMSLVKRNIIANFAGQGWMALMGFVFVPFYLKFIGAEGYGLVGFFVLLSAAMALLDGGLAATATRQVAAFMNADHEERAKTVTLLLTIEGLFWFV